MNILVTGGAGYIGSHTVRLLEQAGGKVVVYDNLITGHRDAVKNSLFVEGDIFDSELLGDTLKRYEISSVVHFAAYSLVGVSMVKPRDYYHNNVVGTLNLLDVMLANGVNKLVFSSTAAVYGEPDSSPITEEMPKNPTNVYGRPSLSWKMSWPIIPGPMALTILHSVILTPAAPTLPVILVKTIFRKRTWCRWF